MKGYPYKLLRFFQIMIPVLAIGIPCGIYVYNQSQQKKAKDLDSAPPGHVTVKDIGTPPPAPALLHDESTAADTLPVQAEGADEARDMPAPERFAYCELISSEGLPLEAQILDATNGQVYIRRRDNKMFKIPYARLDTASVQLVSSWKLAYADSVTLEQKEYLKDYFQESKPPPEDIATADDTTTADDTDDEANDHDIASGPYVKRLDAMVNWKLVKSMSDEFEGRSMDLDKWQIEPVGNGWQWIGRPPAIFRADNVSVHDGKMKVTVSKLDKPVTEKGNRFTHQGAIVRSIEAGEPGWFFECKMKANATEMSSTFWLMTKGHTVKKLELDIQECVGAISPDAAPWAEGWDQIYHSNMIHRTNRFNPVKKQFQNSVRPKKKNCKRFYVYGAWWKNEREVQFFLDGEYVYSIYPDVDWDVPAYIQMAIETYDWNPLPKNRCMVDRGTLEERTTQYEWVRTWKGKVVRD